mmetsp:Transcript_22481/g.37015  ORF Transcript_22481/g.37015 Transcript_22481/m.37015 type:complete len:137 (-) Transcript_22481:209-619(-)
MVQSSKTSCCGIIRLINLECGKFFKYLKYRLRLLWNSQSSSVQVFEYDRDDEWCPIKCFGMQGSNSIARKLWSTCLTSEENFKRLSASLSLFLLLNMETGDDDVSDVTEIADATLLLSGGDDDEEENTLILFDGGS